MVQSAADTSLYPDPLYVLCLCLCPADWPDAGLDMEEKLSFFRETRHAFGRTALLLSGGGSLGSFHLVRFASKHERCESTAPAVVLPVAGFLS